MDGRREKMHFKKQNNNNNNKQKIRTTPVLLTVSVATDPMTCGWMWALYPAGVLDCYIGKQFRLHGHFV